MLETKTLIVENLLNLDLNFDAENDMVRWVFAFMNIFLIILSTGIYVFNSVPLLKSSENTFAEKIFFHFKRTKILPTFTINKNRRFICLKQLSETK